jgi:hypothetical protein
MDTRFLTWYNDKYPWDCFDTEEENIRHKKLLYAGWQGFKHYLLTDVKTSELLGEVIDDKQKIDDVLNKLIRNDYGNRNM